MRFDMKISREGWSSITLPLLKRPSSTFLQFLCILLRENVLVERKRSKNNDEQVNGNESSKTQGLCCANQKETSQAGCPSDEEQRNAEKKRALLNPGSPALLSIVDWISLFDLMGQVAVQNTEQHVKSEAVSIMIMLLQRSNAYYEREKYGWALVFASISKLLQRESGLHGLELRRSIIVLLAFLASTGKSGFEILVSHKLPQDANFLMLILQVLMSEMDLEAAARTDSMETLKARTLLVREGLIILNRLVSHPTYSETVLRLLTNSRHIRLV